MMRWAMVFEQGHISAIGHFEGRQDLHEEILRGHQPFESLIRGVCGPQDGLDGILMRPQNRHESEPMVDRRPTELVHAGERRFTAAEEILAQRSAILSRELGSLGAHVPTVSCVKVRDEPRRVLPYAIEGRAITQIRTPLRNAKSARSSASHIVGESPGPRPSSEQQSVPGE